MRAAEAPLTAREISIRILQQRGVASPDRKMIRGMIKPVHLSLRNHEGKSVEVVGEGIPIKWSIKAN
jgi:hypothetical protein